MTTGIMVDLKGFEVTSVNQRNVMYARHAVNAASIKSESDTINPLGTYTLTGVASNSLTVIRSLVDISVSIVNAYGSLNLGTGRLFVLNNITSAVITNPSNALPALVDILHG